MYIPLRIASSVCIAVFKLFMELISGPFCDEVFDILSAILIRTKILLQTVF